MQIKLQVVFRPIHHIDSGGRQKTGATTSGNVQSFIIIAFQIIDGIRGIVIFRSRTYYSATAMTLNQLFTSCVRYKLTQMKVRACVDVHRADTLLKM